MNNERRKQLRENNKRIDLVIDVLEKYKNEIINIQSDEAEAYDNLPESFQDGMKGQDMQEAIDTMEEITDSLDDIIDKLKDIKGDLTTL